MVRKPTYEELEQRVKKLEKEAAQRMLMDEKVINAEGESAILDSLVEHVIHQDTRMRILWANRAACESAGLTLEELLGRHCYEIWPQREAPCPDCPVLKAMETGQPQKIEKFTPDGKTWFIRGYPVRDDKGRVVGGIEVTLEITDRKRAEEGLRESEDRYRRITEAITDYIYTVTIKDRRPVATIHGPACVAVTGYTTEHFNGSSKPSDYVSKVTTH